LFFNILDNAWQSFPGRKGIIRISVGLKKGREELVMTFQDEGDGMGKDILEKIFNPFFTTKPRGIGLGLTVCQQVVGLHGGKLSINSVKGKGTTVCVRLPVK